MKSILNNNIFLFLFRITTIFLVMNNLLFLNKLILSNKIFLFLLNLFLFSLLIFIYYIIIFLKTFKFNLLKAFFFFVLRIISNAFFTICNEVKGIICII